MKEETAQEILAVLRKIEVHLAWIHNFATNLKLPGFLKK